METWVKGELRKLGLSYREHSSEFFQLKPNRMADAVREAIERLKLTAIEEFPHDFEQIIGKAGDFVSMPTELLECLTATEAQAYWCGAKEALWVLSRLEGVHLSSNDLCSLHTALDFNARHGAPTLASTIVHYFRDHRVREVRAIGEQVAKEIVDLEKNSFSRLPGDYAIGEWRTKRRR